MSRVKFTEENLKVNVMFNGGGFGRRLYNDFIHEAVQISKKIKKTSQADLDKRR